eukprot:CAMPEP_0206546630 /NCGR_PEP_ID=MMETSP0325_2-20121206/12824_1 /ASSEMBLY_ACC=CAM_ASM_000347 /TAXON_ID=2866 /ORGANISM="Crypthecodinium cohnii, Strain Seligo" /LENGTH=269 /DNA_ID=CAMNT_0054045799 /DNA_START=56 /DNA_END=865 /DNA_ORIENTATION=+
MPKRRAEEQLMGNVAVGICPHTGGPIVTMTHPEGGSCQVLVAGACVTSWRPALDNGAERLLPAEASADLRPGQKPGLLEVCNLPSVPASEWKPEQLGSIQKKGGPLSVSLFAEVAGSDGKEGPPVAPLMARSRISLWPNRLLVELEVGNAGDDEAEPGKMLPEVNLGMLGFQGHCFGSGDPSTSSSPVELRSAYPPMEKEDGDEEGMEDPEEVMALCPNIRLGARGYSKLTASPTPAAGGSTRFEAIAPSPIILNAGEVVSGEVSLERM